MIARASDAREKPGVLAACLLAWSDGDAESDEQADRQVGALRVAEFMLRVEAAIKTR